MTTDKTRRSAAERRRERQIENSKRDILDAAAAAFARHGYRAATMQQIAADAGYTAASLYTYFKSKEDIFDALLESVLEEVYATFSPIPGDSLDERLTGLLSKQFALAEKRRDAFTFLMRIANGVEVRPESKNRMGTQQKHEAMIRAWMDWLRENSARGELPEDEIEEAAYAISGLTSAYFRRWLETDQGPLIAQAPRIARRFLYGMRGDGS